MQPAAGKSAIHLLAPGELLCARFRIVRRVGQGAMGVVYEAIDEKLDHRRIALKCAKVGYGERLSPEVRLATEVSHPNVCKIFEIHTGETSAGRIEFFTMEFLAGETLAVRLRAGKLPDHEARAIALQLCAGLAEAHRHHIIHGDLKPGNVIVTKDTQGALRAVITDFGLARGAQEKYSTGGTPGYIAPELFAGAPTSVASDIYALGVILHELLRGSRPDQSAIRMASTVPLRERAIREIPIGARSRIFRVAKRRVRLYSRWDTVLGRCLDHDPSRRYRNVDELANALGPSLIRRRFVMTAAVVALALATAVITHQLATAPQEVVHLAVLPFESGRGTAPWAETLIGDVAGTLAQLKGSTRTKLTVIPVIHAQRTKVGTIENARALLGATHVLHGRLAAAKQTLTVHAYLTDARSLVHARQWNAEYESDEIRYIPLALAGMVTGTLRLPPLVKAPKVNAAAHGSYLAGLSSVRYDTGVEAALTLLGRAVAADSESPLTHAGLAEAQWFKYWLSKDRIWLERAAESVRQAERRNLDLPQVHRIAGLLKAEAGWYPQAAEEYRRAIELEPSNADAYRRLAMAYEHNNQLDEALAAYRRAIDIEPTYYRNHHALGSFYYQRANYSEASRHFKKAVELAPAESNARFALAAAYMSLGRYAEAESELRFAVSLRETASAVHALGYALMYLRRHEEAIPYFLRALRLNPHYHGYLSRMYLEACYRRMHLAIQSERVNRRGLKVAEAALAANPRSGYIRSFVAYFSARLGDRSRAESEIVQALQLSPNDGDTSWTAILTYEALGKRESSLDVLRRVPPELVADLSRWPDVSDLHKDSRFIRLLASHQVN